MKIETIEKHLDEMGFQDWSMKLESGKMCAWSAELRIMLESNPYGPDISTLFYATGGINPESVAERVYKSCKEWKKQA